MSLLVLPRQLVVDVNGVPRVGAKAYFYLPTTTTPITVYTTAAYAVAHANPVLSLSDGLFPAIYTNPNVNPTFKLVIKDSADVTIYTEDNIPELSAITQAQIGSILYPRTPAEIAAGVTPTDYAYLPDPVIDPRRYSADPTGAGDATAAIRKACLVLQAAGGGIIDFADHTFNIYTDTADTAPLGAFSGITGIELRASGAKLVVNRAFSSAVGIPVFTFTACHDINLGDFVGTNPTGARSEIYNRGAQMFWFYQGCSNIRGGNLDLTDWSTGYNFYRVHADPQTYRCKNIRIANIKALRTGYPLVTTESGDELDAHVNTDSCGRSYFNYASRNHKVVVVSKNQDASANCLLYAADGERLSDIDLDYTDTDSTNVAAGTRKGVYIAFRDETPAIIRNIRVRLNVDQGAGTLTNGLSIDKLTLAGALDTVDRGHLLENLQISGRCNTASSPIALGDYTTWGAGESVSNIKIHDLILKTAQPSFYFFSALKDQAIFENVVSEAALNVVGNTTGKIICLGVKAPNVTLSNADTSLVDYIGCNITSGSTQSFINKTFHSTLINGALALQGTVTYNPASLADGAEAITTVTVTGATLGDLALASFSLSTQGIKLTAEVTATDTVTVNFHNKTGGTLDLASGTLKARVIKA